MRGQAGWSARPDSRVWGQELSRETGTWPSALHLPARFRMLKRENPELLQKADCVFSLGDWLNFRLCGVAGPISRISGLARDLNCKAVLLSRSSLAISWFPAH